EVAQTCTTGHSCLSEIVFLKCRRDCRGCEEHRCTKSFGKGEREPAMLQLCSEHLLVAIPSAVVAAHNSFTAHQCHLIEREIPAKRLPEHLPGKNSATIQRFV